MARLLLTATLALALGSLLGGTARAQDFEAYHDTGATKTFLEALVRSHPKRIAIKPIGETTSGKHQILLAIVTDQSTGPASEKPGIFVDGNIHGNERVGGEAALRLIHRLVTATDDSPDAKLLRTHAFWVVPKANPDGADLWVRGIPKAEDDDGDGREDEDGPEDVDGNGWITYMRVVDPEGEWIPDDGDPRVMRLYRSMTVKERKRYRGMRYRVMTEGIDNDQDGQINEDGPNGDVDPNRDFPADTKIERKYRKKYARTGSTRQRGRASKTRRDRNAEPEFLRTKEVRALRDFLEATPSIALGLSFHSYGNALFRPFGYIPDRPSMPRDDLKRLDEVGDVFRRKTGHSGFGPPYLGERQVVGSLHDYTFWSLGYPGFTAEIWSIPGLSRDWSQAAEPPRGGGRGGRGGGRGFGNPVEQQRKMLAYIDQQKLTDAFVEWAPFEHPTLGTVEIGGLWLRQRFLYNPTPAELLKTIDPFVDFALEAATYTPQMQFLSAELRPGAEGVFTVSIEVVNAGQAPSAWALAVKRKLAKPVEVSIELPDGARLRSGSATRELGHVDAGETKRARWAIATREAAPGSAVTVVVRSEKGGVARRRLEIPPPAAGGR